MNDLACTKCGAATKVTRTTKSMTNIQRDRRCLGPGKHLFITNETPAGGGLFVIRRGRDGQPGRVEPLRRKEALEHSLQLAAAGIIAPTRVAQIAEEILRDLFPNGPGGQGEAISTLELGRAALKHLLRESPTAALRYAVVFLTTREEEDVSNVDELLQWILTHVRSAKVLPAPSRPIEVFKHGKRQAEDFVLDKLWRGFERATKGLSRTAAPAGHDWPEEEFVGALVAFVLDEVRGQPAVTSGQLSAAALKVLRSVCPLGYLRFATVAKSYGMLAAFVDESTGILTYPSDVIDLANWRDKGRAIADEIVASRDGTSR